MRLLTVEELQTLVLGQVVRFAEPGETGEQDRYVVLEGENFEPAADNPYYGVYKQLSPIYGPMHRSDFDPAAEHGLLYLEEEDVD